MISNLSTIWYISDVTGILFFVETIEMQEMHAMPCLEKKIKILRDLFGVFLSKGSTQWKTCPRFLQANWGPRLCVSLCKSSLNVVLITGSAWDNGLHQWEWTGWDQSGLDATINRCGCQAVGLTHDLRGFPFLSFYLSHSPYFESGLSSLWDFPGVIQCPVDHLISL